eukprot:TRINITY_DN24821_c0_g1_i1.p1 TRINITY_DN24821_c0_g1~~TRINITY_DN24821_c0_g1_i1.p1  ORF type:complete len:460 (-),score=103.77 TRINITY_DN24821_c0_g1_i1:69-1448(-)
MPFLSSCRLCTALLLIWIFGAESFRNSDADETDAATTQHELIGGCGGDRTVCVVSSNAPFFHPGGIGELMQGCIDSDKDTSVILLAMQDYDAQPLPHYVENLEGIDPKGRFKLRHTVALPGSEAGQGNLCYSRFAGGVAAGAAAGGLLGFKVGLLAHLGGPVIGFGVKAATTTIGAIAGGVAAKMVSSKLGANCGGVAVAVYSLRKVEVAFKSTEPFAAAGEVTEVTATTKKGFVVMRVGISGRQLVVASTHGTEGLRVKKRGDTCSSTGDLSPEEVQQFQKGLNKEKQRVEDFRTALDVIKTFREHSPARPAILWAGDFNPRSVEVDQGPGRGCPQWPTADAAETLVKLDAARDILGTDSKTGDLVTFTELLQGSGLQEAKDLVCPTYKKQPQSSTFSCTENGQTFYYKDSHPPSWTDRVFHSNEPWLDCGALKRVAHEKDHDAVVLTCKLVAGDDCA